MKYKYPWNLIIRIFNDEKVIDKYEVNILQLNMAMFEVLSFNELEAVEGHFKDGFKLNEIRKYLRHPPYSGSYLIRCALTKLKNPVVYKRFRNKK